MKTLQISYPARSARRRSVRSVRVAGLLVLIVACYPDADEEPTPECRWTVQSALGGEACYYSQCIGPPVQPNDLWCEHHPLDTGRFCCDSYYGGVWTAGGNGWWRTGDCPEDPEARYNTCPFYEEDGETFFGDGPV